MQKKGKSFTGKQANLENRLAAQQSVMLAAKKEIYENITQCLCLVRVQLARTDRKTDENRAAIISEVNLILGKVIADLRKVAKRL